MMPTSDEFSWVTSRLLFWQAYDSKCRSEVSCSAHILDKGLIFIDPIPLSDLAEKELLMLAKPFAVIITNGNHSRAADDYRRRYGIPIIANENASADLGNEIDRTVTDGEKIFDQFVAITLPGAVSGEIAVYREGEGVLSLGDVIVNLPGHGFTVLPDKYCQNPKMTRQSLKKLKTLAPKIITFSHGLPIVSKADTRLNQLIDTNL